jgi:hypothetical protein
MKFSITHIFLLEKLHLVTWRLLKPTTCTVNSRASAITHEKSIEEAMDYAIA